MSGHVNTVVTTKQKGQNKRIVAGLNPDLHCNVLRILHSTAFYCTACTCSESVPRREEGSTGKYQHEVKGVPEGAARENSRDRMLVFTCAP